MFSPVNSAGFRDRHPLPLATLPKIAEVTDGGVASSSALAFSSQVRTANGGSGERPSEFAIATSAARSAPKGAIQSRDLRHR